MLKRFQQDILEKIARGDSVKAIAESMCRQAEQFTRNARCTIVTVDRDGVLHPLAAPSLPTAYSDSIEGLKIGPLLGSCGAAAYRGEPVAAEDIESDPLWVDYKHLVEPFGLKSCWSSPIMHSDGRVLGTFAFYFTRHRGPSDQELAVVAECVDLCSIMLEREEVRSENHRLAYFDALTGLSNRASFNRDLSGIRATDAESVGLLLVDLDYLKHVNDTFGHVVGDDLLRETAARIAASAAPGTAYRIGGDEFAVLVHGDEATADVAKIAAAILASTKEPVRAGALAISASVTCGAALSPAGVSRDFQTLLQHADHALYHAKDVARGSFVLHDDGMASTIARRFRSMQCAASALAEHRIEPFYQPLVRLDTREIIGLEALCRIRQDDGRVLAAEAFMEATRDLAIGRLITDRMLNGVARDVRAWLDRGIPVQHVGVNVAMVDFVDGDLHDRISAEFERYDVPLKHVILEVTESVYMDRSNCKVAHAVEKLRREGLLVALDDFGTGYASLTHLLSFPVDIIKIDKSFVGQIENGDAGQVIVKGLIDIAKGLGMRIVAEGIEQESQSVRLGQLGCVLGQGFLFGRPQDAKATTELLGRHDQTCRSPVESRASSAA